ncbi:MAG: ATP-binding protein [Vicinamibacterales bacterium]
MRRDLPPVRVAGLLLALSLLAVPAEARQASPIADVRNLASAAPADRDSTIEGTVTFVGTAGLLAFVQDESGGMAVRFVARNPALTPGTRVVLSGRPAVSERGPTLLVSAIRVVAPDRLPAQHAFVPEAARGGALDGRLLRVQGVVRRSSLGTASAVIALATAAGLVDTVVPRSVAADALGVDAVVTVAGVLAPRATQALGLRDRELLVPDARLVTVTEPAAVDPFALRVLRVRDLPPAASQPDRVRRVKLAGVVLRQRPGRSLYVRDESGPVYVETDGVDPVSPGDVVEVVGFPAVDELAPYVADAVYRRIGTGTPPDPIAVTAPELAEGRHDADLVSVEAEFRGLETGTEELTLVLAQGEVVFNAHVLLARAGDLAGTLFPGDRVRVAGIASTVVDADRRPRAFRLMMRDASDLDVLERPLAARGGWFGAVGLALGLMALAGLGFAWRRISGQQEAIRRQATRESTLRARFDDLFERTSDIMVMHDRRGRVLTMNRAGEQATGYTREELRTLDPGWAFSTEYLEQIERLIREGVDAPAHAFRAEIVNRTNTRLPVEVHARVQAADGQVSGVSVVARNLAEREQLEAQLRQAQKMEAVGRLATGIAHDFNNLITVLLGYSDELLEQVDPQSELHQPASEIRRAAERAEGLTQQLLAFSRRHTTSPQSIDLNVAVRNMQDLLRRLLGAEIELRVTLAPDLGLIRADTAQIGQVVMNLAVNARDAMPEGGFLRIETANVDIGSDDLDAIPGPHVMLLVADTGHGMSDDVQQRLFEPFFTTKERGQGTGLGLSMVQGIVRQAGGHVRVESRPGRGSIFRMYFPRVDEPIEATPPAPATAPASIAPPKASGVVLFAEDDRAVRRLMTAELRRRGYTVLEARHGGEALEICRQYGADIDLLVTDVVMPQMNGADLAQAVRPIRPDMAVLFISGHPERAGAGLDPNGPDAANLILKPFTPETLSARVNEVLRSRRG